MGDVHHVHLVRVLRPLLLALLLAGCAYSARPPLRFADLLRDIDLLTIARREAASLLSRDPELLRPEHAVTSRVLAERWAHCDLTLE